MITLKEHKVIITCDVTFKEQIFPFKLQQASDAIMEYLIPGGLTELGQNKREQQQGGELELPLIPPQVTYPSVTPQLNQTPSLPRPTYAQIAATTSVPVDNQQPRVTTPIVVFDKAKEEISIQPQNEVVSQPCNPATEAPTGGVAPDLANTPNIQTRPKPYMEHLTNPHHSSTLRNLMQGFDPKQKRARTPSLRYRARTNEDLNLCQDEQYTDEWLMMARETYSFEQVMSTPEQPEWSKAADAEIQAFIDNDVYELVPPPKALRRS